MTVANYHKLVLSEDFKHCEKMDPHPLETASPWEQRWTGNAESPPADSAPVDVDDDLFGEVCALKSLLAQAT